MMASHREQVLALVQKWAGVVPPGGIRAEHYLIDDLEMDGDDYGMSLVPELERHFGISPKYKEWEIETVGQLLEVIDRHVALRGGDERASA
jgi:hypothetical protein